MLFNSLLFIFGFLPITYLVYWRLKTKNQRYLWLTIAGYVFYGTWNYKFCALMAFSTAVSYFAGLGLLRWDDPHRRKLCLVLPITVDLTLLGFFKYVNFTLGTVSGISRWLGFPLHFPALGIILPVGISFYTFHTITYIVDSYRRTITPTKNFFEFSCYVSLFPQLVAGPIVRFRQVENDLEHLDSANRKGFLDIGWSFFAIGLMKKVLIADTIATVINPAFLRYSELSSLGTWLVVLGYTYQLYFDFSGYSDMAVGLAYLFGIRLPQNFNSPYKAVDIADFWRRWHISLSTCLRDYLYIPLGGSRSSKSWLTYRNLMITMLLGGLWHGANWTFVFWGGYHGVLLSLNRTFAQQLDMVNAAVRRIVTFLLVMIGWVFFRSDNFSMAMTLLHKMFSIRSGISIPGILGLVLSVILAASIAHFSPNTFEIQHDWNPVQVTAITLAFVLCIMVVTVGQRSPFLYFQF
ncbi:MAG TPA: MBOAT family O-acyltransferase [Candidatus Acidoferrales bacterium]|jgi:alginate O-acetyltransferase complex protein AlgI|nr:MBOAT family O-acyltransferase [Candidatus Acidoferrales bacterium]